MRGGLQAWHIIVLAVLLVVLFGAKRLPDAARSLGRSMRILKAETRGLHDDDVAAKAEAQTGHQVTPERVVLDSEPSRLTTPDPVDRVRDK